MKVVYHPVGNFPYPKTDSGRLTQRRSRKPPKSGRERNPLFLAAAAFWGVCGLLSLSLSFPALHCSVARGEIFSLTLAVDMATRLFSALLLGLLLLLGAAVASGSLQPESSGRPRFRACRRTSPIKPAPKHEPTWVAHIFSCCKCLSKKRHERTYFLCLNYCSALINPSFYISLYFE